MLQYSEKRKNGELQLGKEYLAITNKLQELILKYLFSVEFFIYIILLDACHFEPLPRFQG